MMQSFWATLKKELVYLKPRFKTRQEARAAIFHYIEIYYNRARIHSSLDYRTPLSFEEFLASQQQIPELEKLAA
jgi:putative transposase